MRRLTQVTLVGVVILAVASIATAQQALQPVYRLGNFLEVGNDVFMHIIAATESRFQTVENRDFEQLVRDRTNSRFPGDTASMRTDADAMIFQNRLGAEFRYQKNLEVYLLFQHEQFVDGNTIDDRSNSTQPGGTDAFGRAAGTENPGFHTERYWIRYKFPGTPLKLHVGADLWNVDQAGLVGDDDPRIALFADFGNFDAMAAAVMQYSSQRIGLENNNNLIYYTFSAGYNLRPHRFQFDVVYFHDRFAGADLTNGASTSPTGTRGVGTDGIGYQGQKSDSVLLMLSWSGQVGPVRALLQANGVVGRAQGCTAGISPCLTTVSQRAYDILAGAGVGYVEVDVGIVKPYVAFVIGTPDSNATDRHLRGFAPASWRDVTQITGVSWFEHLDISTNFAGRDYACPARNQGIRSTPLPGNPLAIGSQVTGGPTSGNECSHSVTQAFNQRLGSPSHLGLFSTYSNPGTLVAAPGVKVYPLRGHELVGFYVYRAMLNSALLEQAFVVGVDPGYKGKFDLAQAHEVGGYWQWTLNPYFDIRLAGTMAFLGEGFKQLANLDNCTHGNQQPFTSCEGKSTALRGELRFRARF